MKSHLLLVVPVSLGLVAAACSPIQTHNEVVIKQDKPLEVNVNVHADINVVVSDARQDMEQINGSKPLRTVSPADIGLDTDATQPAPSSSRAGGGLPPLARGNATPALYLADFGVAAPQRVAREDDLKAALHARAEQVRALLDTHNAGEAHTGMLDDPHPDQSALTADQKKLLEAENKDRAELYKIEAQAKGTTEDKVALAHYLARLDYAKKGDWYERVNKETKKWEWATWDK